MQLVGGGSNHRRNHHIAVGCARAIEIITAAAVVGCSADIGVTNATGDIFRENLPALGTVAIAAGIAFEGLAPRQRDSVGTGGAAADIADIALALATDGHHTKGVERVGIEVTDYGRSILKNHTHPLSGISHIDDGIGSILIVLVNPANGDTAGSSQAVDSMHFGEGKAGPLFLHSDIVNKAGIAIFTNTFENHINIASHRAGNIGIILIPTFRSLSNFSHSKTTTDMYQRSTIHSIRSGIHPHLDALVGFGARYAIHPEGNLIVFVLGKGKQRSDEIGLVTNLLVGKLG